MLLLVLNPEFEKGCGLAPRLCGSLLDEPRHRGVDMIAIGGDDIDGRTRQQPALRSRMTRASGLVIRVEEVSKCRIEHPVTGVESGQDKGLEKPRRMRQMPFRRADIGHRLDSLILGR